jgi:hypothetical protein
MSCGRGFRLSTQLLPVAGGCAAKPNYLYPAETESWPRGCSIQGECFSRREITYSIRSALGIRSATGI